ncbi:hypothetical protein C8F04DRAFT_1048301 [Mycena alexandri]|uniref:MYND-type domain-containing protein n=1 Tax=Mycena alexandri TaxID=1745969 RepID=A0AAD6WS78_9AGAR|nr:hypothetical protein C8F04DRAFT_1048301 [Mycena alexandri]
MDSARQAQLQEIIEGQKGVGRPLSELMKTNETLKGAESQRLRTFFTSNCMEPDRDLDQYGRILAMGDLDGVKADFEERVARHAAMAPDSGAGPSTGAAAVPLSPGAAAAQDIYALCWGPTLVPIYNLLGLLRIIFPENAREHLAIARFMIETAKVPIDKGDLSGTRALSHALSTKPGFDFEYAQLLYDAGGDVNTRNRYGGTVAHEIALIWAPKDVSAVARSIQAFKWFLEHGGSVDIADGDGMTVRQMARRLASSVPSLNKLIAETDRKRKGFAKTPNSCCGLCGRGDADMRRCGRCKATRYCDPSARDCQKLDWPHHKKNCVKVMETDTVSFLGNKFTA